MAPPTTCGNPLLLEWLEEMVQEASSRGYKSLPTLRKARDSMKACSKMFQHPSEAIELQGVGEKMVKTLTEKLQKHCADNGIVMPSKPKHKRKRTASALTEGDEDDNSDAEPPRPSKKPAKKPRAYVPGLRSGAYALLLALATLPRSSREGITKEQLIPLAQPHCDSSFTKPTAGKYFTAWDSIKTLVNKDMVYTKKNPATRYYLTEEGWDLAESMKKSSDPSQGRMADFVSAEAGPSTTTNTFDDSEIEVLSDSPDPSEQPPSHTPTIPDGAVLDSNSSLPKFTPIILRPGTFTIELIVDTREVASKKDRDYISDHFTERSIPHSVRALPLGDFLWVARVAPEKAPWLNLDSASNSIILDHIIERKRLDDLISSIKDHRYDEQKFRLKKLGVKNVTYLIEHIQLDPEHRQNWELAVDTSIAKIQVVDKFHVKQTDGLKDTLPYIERMHKLLTKIYEGRPLYVVPTNVLTTNNHLALRELPAGGDNSGAGGHHITFEAFEALASKSNILTLKDVFLKMLLCTKGIGPEKAVEIQKRWSTPRRFLEAYAECAEDAGREKEKDKDKGKGKGPAVVIMTEKEKRDKKMREMVSDQLGGLVGRKKVGGLLSAKLAEVWGDAGVDVDG
ncbi:crossover junction endonuclease MUS81 protein [Rutstroemia sp. NJR-2017a WRK4]|nr:crossover junction endonuclease MUS81 protein [Rutstroemia sp. NJR-2017a WRK4]